MPFTPFHFGPGLLVKSLAGKRFWLTSFVAANVLIDFEVLYLIYRGQRPLHQFLHTYLGGSVAGIVAGLGVFAVVWFVGPRFAPDLYKRLFCKSDRLREAAASIVAGLIGGVSHVFLDSLIHHDVRKFWGWSAGFCGCGGCCRRKSLRIPSWR